MNETNQKIIELDRVTKRYGRLKALDDFTVSVRPGAVGLLGPNGAGKSTLIKMLLGLVGLTDGEARVLGLDVRKHSRRIRRLVGYMPEDDCYVSGLEGIEAVAFAGELAGLPPRTARRRAHEILDYVLVSEERYREVQTYSGGMRQKIRLAQAIIHAPRLLFLDEPTSGLDPAGRERMLHLIRDLARRGISVVVSTHILKDVEMSCDSVLLLGGGRLLMYDTLENLSETVDRGHQVTYTGNGEDFIARLQTAGFRIEPGGDQRVRVFGDDGDRVPNTVFRIAEEAGVSVRDITRGRTSLEETFLSAVRGDSHAPV